MRVFLVAAVLGMLGQQAFAFDYDNCRSLKSSALDSYKFAMDVKGMAADLISESYSKLSEEEQELHKKWSGWADEAMKKASNYANVYQAFCKD